MDDGRFDAVIRVLGSGAPRRRVLAGLLAAVPLAVGGNAVARKKKKCKGKKKCGNRCIPKTACCISTDCPRGTTCTNGACVCIPNCAGKVCGDDGCGGSCGTCQNGTCAGGSGQCVCAFPQSGQTCSPGVCCAQEQACVGGACGACPEAPDPCLPAQEHFCGRTTAASPFCFCVTSIDDETTCSSIFVNPSQAADCDSDDDCAGLLGPGVEMVCVNAPCLGLSVDKVCMNKGCVNLNAPRSESRSDRASPAMEQRSFPARR